MRAGLVLSWSGLRLVGGVARSPGRLDRRWVPALRGVVVLARTLISPLAVTPLAPLLQELLGV